jgi:hypothetical protein
MHTAGARAEADDELGEISFDHAPLAAQIAATVLHRFDGAGSCMVRSSLFRICNAQRLPILPPCKGFRSRLKRRKEESR